MSDEMPNTMWMWKAGDGSVQKSLKQEPDVKGEYHDTHTSYTRTDWLRSQIEGMKKPKYSRDSILGQQAELSRNAALDQILTLLETGEKK